MNRYILELDAGYCLITRLFDSTCEFEVSCESHMRVILNALGLTSVDAKVAFSKGDDGETLVMVDGAMPAIVRLTRYRPGEWITIPMDSGQVSSDIDRR